MNPLLTLSGTELAAKIRRGEATSVEVVSAHVRHIGRVNPHLNAVVFDRFAAALEEARAADERLAKEGAADLPPFHGVPCTIKECFAVKGMPHTSGLVARVGRLATEDAPAVARLRQAGAVVLGVTNVPELCLWIETNNRVYGRTRNPYNLRHIVGGSSGGEGAIIGAGGSPFGLGSDIGGSIRFPAFCNGVFGHKPSGGLVPNTGQFPLPGEGAEIRRMITTGPLARRGEDLMPLLRVLAGPDGRDKGCRPFRLGDPATVRLADLTIYTVADNGLLPVAEDLRAAQQRAAAVLREEGARVRKTRFHSFKQSFQIYGAMLEELAETSVRELLGDGRPFSPAREWARWAVGRSPHTFPLLMLALQDGLPPALLRPIKKFAEVGRALRSRLAEFLGSSGVILYPSFTSAAPRHNTTLRRPLGLFYAGIFNVLEFAVTQVPLGLNDQGLPLGVQVAAAPGNDHVTIAAALALERRLGGWVPPWTAQKRRAKAHAGGARPLDLERIR